jgi:lysophospholipase L1-like esterase
LKGLRTAGFALCAISLIAGCGGGDPPPPSLNQVSVQPNNSSVLLGQSQQFIATGRYSDGSTQNLTELVTWNSSSPAVATVSNVPGTSGIAHSASKGVTTISATVSGITGSTGFTVKVLTTVVISPQDPNVGFQSSQQFTATGLYSDGSSNDLTDTVTWVSLSPSVSTISNHGLAQALTPGTASIRATSPTGVSGSTTITVVPPPTVSIAPNNSAINYSDDYTLALTATSATFSRPLVDGQGLNSVAPGARIRFQSAAPYVVIHLSYTNLATLQNAYNGVGIVLVNGAFFTNFDQPQLAAGAPVRNVDVVLTFASATSRLIEIVLPYCASVSLLGIDVDATSPNLSPVQPRPSGPLLVLGDSITQGFYATGIGGTWPFLLSQAKGWQVVNGGYGGRIVVPSDATLLAPSSISPRAITYLIGYNDFAEQEPLATFYASYVAYLNNLRIANPTSVIYCITPLWTSSTAADYGGTIEIESYRQQIRNAVAAINNPLNVLVEGESLVTNSSDYFYDGIHPNDAGSQQMATTLAAVISP